MARRRRAYRRSRRRSLSTRRIFGNRSARSQANQIYALRKRVASINRRLRPDIKVVDGNWPDLSKTFTNNAVTNTWYAKWYGTIGVGTGDTVRTGDRVYTKSLTLSAVFEYANNFTAEPVTVEAKGATVRIVVLQAKTASGFGEDITDPASIISKYTGTGGGYDLNTVAPLANGITKTWAVLRDMRFRLTDDNPIRQLVLRIKPRFRTLRFENREPEGGGDPVINPNHGFLVFVCVSGLHWMSSVSEQVSMNGRLKYTFTDM